MPELGCSTWCLMDHPLAEALEILAARTGTVEILSDATHDLLAGAQAYFSFDLCYTIHAPTTDINIASCREPIRKASIRILRDVCRTGAEIGARCVVVHPGFFPWDQVRGRSWDALLQSLKELAAVQDEHGVPIAVENLGSWHVCHFRDPSLLPVLQETGLSFCLDVGHAHLNGVLGAFLDAGTPLHVHLHDNDGSADSHLALGKGSIDYPEIYSRLPQSATWIVEVQELEDFDGSVRFLQELERHAAAGLSPGELKNV